MGRMARRSRVMTGGKPTWGKVVQNPDGSFSPVVEKRQPAVEWDLTLEDMVFLKEVGIEI